MPLRDQTGPEGKGPMTGRGMGVGKTSLAFDKCVLAKGTVSTVKGPNKQHGLKSGEYCRYCVKGGKSFKGGIQKSQINPMIERLKHGS